MVECCVGVCFSIDDISLCVQANLSLFMNLAGGRHVPSTLAAVERLFSECDVLGDGQLGYTEAVVCWQLLETDEFMLLSVLSGVSAVPDLYGACGNMYAMQYATSDPFLAYLPSMADNRSWNFRARLAISLIEMVHSLEATPYGTLYLCDVQEANFGVVRRPGTGELVAKTIDVDISWFEPSMKSSVVFEKNKSCQSHHDCDFISCHVACSKTTHTCSGRLWSNNLQVNHRPSIGIVIIVNVLFQVICRRLFVQKLRGFSGLLRDPPKSVEGELRSVLERCISSSTPQPHINTSIMKTLLSLLHTSLLTETPPL